MGNDKVRVRAGRLDATGLRLGIVASRFNEVLVQALVDGAIEEATRLGAMSADLQVVWVPGAFEIPQALQRVVRSGSVDAGIALGAIVRGETPHFDYVAAAAADGVARIALEQPVPVSFGVLTTDTWEQAVDRAGGKLGNKGAEAVRAAVEMASLLKNI